MPATTNASAAREEADLITQCNIGLPARFAAPVPVVEEDLDEDIIIRATPVPHRDHICPLCLAGVRAPCRTRRGALVLEGHARRRALVISKADGV